MSGSELLAELRSALLLRLNGQEDTDDLLVRREIDAVLSEHPTASVLPVSARRRIAADLFDAVRRFDLLQELLDDPAVTEIMVNGPDSIFVERAGRIERWDRTFPSSELLMDVIGRIAGRCNRVINERSPIVDARMPDGSRINAIVAPAALDGPVLTIRRFPACPITMRDLVRYGSLTEEAADVLRVLVKAGYSILISGGTSSGKTTFLNALSAFVPSSERIITIEDNAELQIQNIPNLVRLEAKSSNMEGAPEITIRDLIRSALRSRPDRIIVGEVRGGEAVDMLQALNTGHDGSMSTVHANSAADCLSRLETMVLMALPLPIPAIRRQILSGVDLIVHLARIKGKRLVLSIEETLPLTEGDLTNAPPHTLLRTLYRYDLRAGVLRREQELLNREKLLLTGLDDETI